MAELTEIVARARAFAVTSHGAQVRKYSDLPYVVHLDAVAAVLSAHGHDAPVMLSAAYLHDVVEDTEATIQHIYDEFGPEIAELVYWLTDAETGKRRIRKTMSAWRLGRAPFEAKLVKLADVIDNATDLSRYDKHFAPVYKREARDILARMHAVEGDALAALAIYRDASSDRHPARLRRPRGDGGAPAPTCSA